MYFVSFDNDGREGTRRTDILTGAAADASLFVDGRHHGRLLVVLVEHHHLDGSRRTVAGTVATLHAVGQRHAILLNPHGVTDMNSTLLGFVERHDGTGRTNLRTARTLRTTIATLVGHDGQHQMQQVRRGA